MANTQTTVPTFIPGQVLEASQLVNSAATGVPVFATTGTRDAGFGGAGEKALAEGQLCYLESTNVVQYYDGAAWATLAPAPAVSSGLTLIATGSLSGASTTFSSAFSATYRNYFITINEMTCSAGNPDMYFTLGAATTNYAYSQMYVDQARAWSFNQGSTSDSKIIMNNMASTDPSTANIQIDQPFLTNETSLIASGLNYQQSQWFQTAGKHNANTSFTSFTISNSTGATMTGSVAIYGFGI